MATPAIYITPEQAVLPMEGVIAIVVEANQGKKDKNNLYAIIIPYAAPQQMII
jgi:hypothetical protein